MKKRSFKVGALLISGALLCSSCIGSFSLFNKYEKWQCNMTSNKYVNGIVGLVLQPIVGGICLFVDALVLNTIEFWSGNSPMAAGEVKEVKGQDGKIYLVTTLENGYEVKAPDGDVTLFIHDSKTDIWSMQKNGKVLQLFTVAPDNV